MHLSFGDGDCRKGKDGASFLEGNELMLYLARIESEQRKITFTQAFWSKVLLYSNLLLLDRIFTGCPTYVLGVQAFLEVEPHQGVTYLWCYKNYWTRNEKD